MQITEEHLDSLNRRFEGAEPIELLRFVAANFGARAAILSSMQKAGTVLCHMANQGSLSFDVLFVDTGVLHQQTLETRDLLAKTHTKLNVITLRPKDTFAEQTKTQGLLYLTKEGQESCCDLRKVAPLRAIRGRYDVFLSALRRSEGGARSKVKPFSLDTELNVLRVHPLHAIDTPELDDYLTKYPDVVVNPLHSMGFPTIGCFPCTTPVLPDEPERAGRWRHLVSVTYCGINPVDTGAQTKFIELDDKYTSLFLINDPRRDCTKIK